jgi:hypothetical protein
MPKSEPSVMDYIRRLFVKVIGLPEVFADVNKNFISAMVDDTFILAGDSVDLAALQTVAADSGADILPVEQDVRRAARAVSKKWWRSFIYDYVLVAVQAKLHEVVALK